MSEINVTRTPIDPKDIPQPKGGSSNPKWKNLIQDFMASEDEAWEVTVDPEANISQVASGIMTARNAQGLKQKVAVMQRKYLGVIYLRKM